MTASTLAILNANGQIQYLKVEIAATILTPHSAPEIDGEVVSLDNPMPTSVVNTQIIPTLPEGPPGTIGASDIYVSGITPSSGCKAAAAGVTLSQTGTLTLQRYMDEAGLVAIGVPIVQALTAATPGWVVANDGIPFLTFQISIENTSVSSATATNFASLLSAN